MHHYVGYIPKLFKPLGCHLWLLFVPKHCSKSHSSRMSYTCHYFPQITRKFYHKVELIKVGIYWTKSLHGTTYLDEVVFYHYSQSTWKYGQKRHYVKLKLVTKLNKIPQPVLMKSYLVKTWANSCEMLTKNDIMQTWFEHRSKSLH